MPMVAHQSLVSCWRGRFETVKWCEGSVRTGSLSLVIAMNEAAGLGVGAAPVILDAIQALTSLCGHIERRCQANRRHKRLELESSVRAMEKLKSIRTLYEPYIIQSQAGDSRLPLRRCYEDGASMSALRVKLLVDALRHTLDDAESNQRLEALNTYLIDWEHQLENHVMEKHAIHASIPQALRDEEWLQPFLSHGKVETLSEFMRRYRLMYHGKLTASHLSSHEVQSAICELLPPMQESPELRQVTLTTLIALHRKYSFPCLKLCSLPSDASNDWHSIISQPDLLSCVQCLFLDDWREEKEHLPAVIEGPAGSGKTLVAYGACCALPKTQNILYLVFNKAAEVSFHKQLRLGGCQNVRCMTFASFNGWITRGEEGVDLFTGSKVLWKNYHLRGGYYPFDTIIFDEARSYVTRSVLQCLEVLEVTKKARHLFLYDRSQDILSSADTFSSCDELVEYLRKYCPEGEFVSYYFLPIVFRVPYEVHLQAASHYMDTCYEGRTAVIKNDRTKFRDTMQWVTFPVNAPSNQRGLAEHISMDDVKYIRKFCDEEGISTPTGTKRKLYQWVKHAVVELCQKHVLTAIKALSESNSLEWKTCAILILNSSHHVGEAPWDDPSRFRETLLTYLKTHPASRSWDFMTAEEGCKRMLGENSENSEGEKFPIIVDSVGKFTGCEADYVILVVNPSYNLQELIQDKCRIYVGLTRAQNHLTVIAPENFLIRRPNHQVIEVDHVRLT
jgi:hypothetical protein